MSRLVRWDPFRDFVSLRNEMDRLLEQLPASGGDGAGWTPPMDVSETDDRFELELDLPGMNSENIEITLDQNVLTVRGERVFKEETNQQNYHRIERRYGSFYRSVSLPAPADADGIQASFTDGVLHIVVPKAEQAKPRRIKVGENTRQLEA